MRALLENSLRMMRHHGEEEGSSDESHNKTHTTGEFAAVHHHCDVHVEVRSRCVCGASSFAVVDLRLVVAAKYCYCCCQAVKWSNCGSDVRPSVVA